GDSDVPSFGTVLDGVVDEVDDCLTEYDSIHECLDRMIGLNGYILSLLLAERGQVLYDLARKLGQIHVFRIQPDLSGIGARKRQKAIDEPCEAVGLFEHAADDLAIGGRAAMFPKTDFADATNCGERCPQFVRSIGRKAPESFKGVFQS